MPRGSGSNYDSGGSNRFGYGGSDPRSSPRPTGGGGGLPGSAPPTPSLPQRPTSTDAPSWAPPPSPIGGGASPGNGPPSHAPYGGGGYHQRQPHPQPAPSVPPTAPQTAPVIDSNRGNLHPEYRYDNPIHPSYAKTSYRP